jgi:hypothetical protein
MYLFASITLLATSASSATTQRLPQLADLGHAQDYLTSRRHRLGHGSRRALQGVTGGVGVGRQG